MKIDGKGFEQDRLVDVILSLCVILGTISWIPNIPNFLLLSVKYGLFFVILCVSISRYSGKCNSLLKYYFVYFVALAVSYVYSIVVKNGDLSGGIFCLFPLLVCVAMSICVNVSKYAVVVSSLIYSGLIHAFYVICSYVFQNNYAPRSIVGSWCEYQYSAMGLTNSHTMASPVIAISIGLLLINWREISLTAYIKILLLIASVYGLILTTGEGGEIVLIVSFSLVFFSYKFQYRLLVILLCFVCAIFSFYIVGYYISEEMHSSYVEHVVANKAGWNMFVNNVYFGVGPMMSYKYFSKAIMFINSNFRLYSASLTPHTSFGLLIAENGIFGIIGVLIVSKIVLTSISKICLFSNYGRSAYFVIVFFMFLSLLEPWPMISNMFASYIFFSSVIFAFMHKNYE